MTKRLSVWAILFTMGVVLQSGCVSVGTWKAYPGKTLPNKETALIKLGSDLHRHDWHIDGERIPGEYVVLLWVPGVLGLGDAWDRKAIRVLPGEHEIGLWSPRKALAFEAEAGRVYTFFWKPVGETQLDGQEDESGLVVEGEEREYIWMEDESGTVIAGEKPPPG